MDVVLENTRKKKLEGVSVRERKWQGELVVDVILENTRTGNINTRILLRKLVFPLTKS